MITRKIFFKEKKTSAISYNKYRIDGFYLFGILPLYLTKTFIGEFYR